MLLCPDPDPLRNRRRFVAATGWAATQKIQTLSQAQPAQLNRFWFFLDHHNLSRTCRAGSCHKDWAPLSGRYASRTLHNTPLWSHCTCQVSQPPVGRFSVCTYTYAFESRQASRKVLRTLSLRLSTAQGQYHLRTSSSSSKPVVGPCTSASKLVCRRPQCPSR